MSLGWLCVVFFFFLSFYNFACFCCLALGYFTMIKFFGSKQGIGNSEKASFFFFFLDEFYVVERILELELAISFCQEDYKL